MKNKIISYRLPFKCVVRGCIISKIKIYAKTPDAKALAYKAGDFSYNTGKLRCPTCDGTGTISLDVQFLPDVEIPCPDCRGSRYAKEAERIKRRNKAGQSYSLPELMDMDVKHALTACEDLKTVQQRLQVLQDLGLGYLTLGEETPSLSGGEDGGRIVATGTPSEVAKNPQSITGKYLK